MLNVTCRGSTWQFYRRVPKKYKEFDSRRFVRGTLKTKCKKDAIRLAGVENTRLIEYWESLVKTGQKHGHHAYTQAVERSTILGFQYIPKLELANGNLEELVKRLLFVFDRHINEKQAEAVLGGVPEPEILLSDLLPKFWDYKKEIKLEKSDRQYKRWAAPRKLAMRYFIEVVGEKPVQQLSRDDMLKFKDWWIERMGSEEKISPNTANKMMDQVKNIIETVCDNLKIKIDGQHIFKKLFFKKERKRRAAFSTEHILNVLLNDQKLAGISDHYKRIIQIFAETGASIDEQVGIRPENIILNHEIPHIIITSYEKDKLKTEHRERIIPLVGFALEAFRAYPKGFSKIVQNPETASTSIGKYLRENKMLPSERHSLYSLRHSFQDRLTNLDCPDRIQTDLMGHAFTGRIKYGDGASLANSYKWMKRIELKTII